MIRGGREILSAHFFGQVLLHPLSQTYIHRDGHGPLRPVQVELILKPPIQFHALHSPSLAEMRDQLVKGFVFVRYEYVVHNSIGNRYLI